MYNLQQATRITIWIQ